MPRRYNLAVLLFLLVGSVLLWILHCDIAGVGYHVEFEMRIVTKPSLTGGSLRSNQVVIVGPLGDAYNIQFNQCLTGAYMIVEYGLILRPSDVRVPLFRVIGYGLQGPPIHQSAHMFVDGVTVSPFRSEPRSFTIHTTNVVVRVMTRALKVDTESLDRVRCYDALNDIVGHYQ